MAQVPVKRPRAASKATRSFEVHEDTSEENMILMHHSTSILHIAADRKGLGHFAEDVRGEENVPPMDDWSQTATELPVNHSKDRTELAARLRKKKLREAITRG